ncbi:MAG: DUF2330 domain-containing protein [Myxococcota bacterium]
MLFLSLMMASPHADAFCGAYVGNGESSPTNRASQIVIARSGTSTTLTMFNDYEGDLAAFGLVVPVPAGVDSDNVRLADRTLLEKLDGYSQPRQVAYTCDDWYGVSEAAVEARQLARRSSGGGCGGSSNDSGGWYTNDSGVREGSSGDTGVHVIDEFDLGEYTAWVVAAEGSEGLMAWLSANGFAVDDTTSAVFDEYIAAGSHFLALRVDLDEAPATNWLSPLQVGYDTEAWSLPIRMGAASSAGVQDLVVYAVTEPDAGRVGISNYVETPAPAAECLVDIEEGGSVLDWYETQFELTTGLPATPETLGGRQGFAWTTEYGWGSGACDPCTNTGPLTQDDVTGLGFDAHYGWYLTRLHLRYTPEAVTEDISFYASRVTENTQLRYVSHTWELESAMPTCGALEGAADAPACYSSEYWARKEQEGEAGTSVRNDDFKKCGGSSAALLLLPLLFWRRRW